MTQTSESSRAGGMSFEEFRMAPGDPLAEWVAGRVVGLAEETPAHALIREWLFELLDAFVRREACGEAFSARLMRLVTRSARRPDVAVVLNENRALVWDDHLGGPADLVVEIVREGAEAADYSDRFYEYEASGVREYWFIDPAAQRAEFYVRQQDGQFRGRPTSGGVYRSETLPGFVLQPEWFWTLPDLDLVRSE
jgi:Uma2 family endonuclease